MSTVSIRSLHLYIVLPVHRIKGRAAQKYPSLLANMISFTTAVHTAFYISSATAR